MTTINRQLDHDAIVQLLDKWAPEPESFEDRIWSKVEKRLARNGAIAEPAPLTLTDQVHDMIDSHGLYDVLQSVRASCEAKCSELHGDLYWARAAVLIGRALPVATRLPRPVR